MDSSDLRVHGSTSILARIDWDREVFDADGCHVPNNIQVINFHGLHDFKFDVDSMKSQKSRAAVFELVATSD